MESTRFVGEIHSYTYAVFFIIVLVFLQRFRERELRHIPTVGFSPPILSFIGATQFLLASRQMMRQGYEKHKGSVYKIPNFTRWTIVLNGPKLSEELRKAPDNVLSFKAAADELVHAPYTLGNISENPIHTIVVRNQLTRNLSTIVPALHDEVVCAFRDLLPPKKSGWMNYNASDIFLQLVSRTSNRVFVGLPLCRNKDYNEDCIEFTLDVVKLSIILDIVPSFLAPIASSLFGNITNRVRRVAQHVGPLIETRKKQEEEFGKDYPDKPVDMLSWLLDEAKGDNRSLESLTRRLLSSNFAAIHTTSTALVHALYDLASNTHYIKPLRDEIKEVIEQEGWTKNAVDRMHRLDSFIRESQRLRPIGSMVIFRKALQDYTFADGTFVPKGALITLPMEETQRDEANYVNPDQFDGFRFVNMSNEDGHRRYDIVTTDAAFIAFGHGRHACPGRFFAAAEMKLIMAQLIMLYDVKFENEGVRPPDTFIGQGRIPSRSAQVMFRSLRDSV